MRPDFLLTLLDRELPEGYTELDPLSAIATADLPAPAREVSTLRGDRHGRPLPFRLKVILHTVAASPFDATAQINAVMIAARLMVERLSGV
jgi:hypothetical protein